MVICEACKGDITSVGLASYITRLGTFGDQYFHPACWINRIGDSDDALKRDAGEAL
mgnify:CR=1 FL=1